MESKDNNNRSEDASKGVGETSDSAVKNECCDKQKADDAKNGVNKEKNVDKDKVETVKNGKIPVNERSAVQVDKGNVESKICDEKKDITNSLTEERKGESKHGNDKGKEQHEKNVDKNEVAIQKPKRTKSRKSLNKTYSINNIDVNGNASIQRTDR